MDPQELLPNVNTGVLVQPPLPTDFILGGETGITVEVRNPFAYWEQYLPTDEAQIGVYFDTMACVTFSALNCVEAQMNFLKEKNLIPQDALQKLTEMGFFDEFGRFNCSDRFTAKMSGTTRNGNYLASVWDSIRNDGILPEKDWPYPRDQRTPVFDWNEYYKEIPQELKDKALKSKEIIETRYQWVAPGIRVDRNALLQSMKIAPLQNATAVCSPWNTTEIIPACTLSVGHATMIWRLMDSWTDIFDHYKPFRKRLALNYNIPFIMQGVVYIKSGAPTNIQPPTTPPSQQPANPPDFKHRFIANLRFGEKSNEVKALQDALKIDGTFPKNVISTGFYGNITAKAVYAFQTKYKVASPQELISLKGQIAGKKTRAKLNQLFNK